MILLLSGGFTAISSEANMGLSNARHREDSTVPAVKKCGCVEFFWASE